MPFSFTARRRNQLALAFSALIFIAIGVGIFVGARRSLADAALVSHTHEVIGRVDEIQARVLDAESAQRGFLLTGNDAYLLDYQTSVERLPILLGNLRRLIADNPAQVQHLDTLRHLVETRLQQIQHVLDVYAQDGLEPARAGIRQTAFRTTSAIREQALTMVQREQELLTQRAEGSRQSAALLLVLALAGIPFGLAVVGTVYALLMRELRHRSQAEKLAAQANRELGDSVVALQRSTADLNLLSRYTGLLQSCISAEEALVVTSRTLASLLPGVAGRCRALPEACICCVPRRIAPRRSATGASRWCIARRIYCLKSAGRCAVANRTSSRTWDGMRCVRISAHPSTPPPSPPHACRCLRKAPSSASCSCLRRARGQCRGWKSPRRPPNSCHWR